MKRIALVILFCCGCGSGGASVDPALLRAAGCLGLGVGDLAAITEGFLGLIDEIESPGGGPANVTYDPGTGEYTIMVDLDRDGSAETTISGTVASTDDLSDGFDPGEEFDAPWQISGGSFTGSGTLTFEALTAMQLDITGSGTVANNGCSFQFSNASVTVDPTNEEDIGPTGGLDFTATDGATITGHVTFLGPGTDAFVTTMFGGETVEPEIDLDTFEVFFDL